MVFCSKCGTQINEGSAFCQNCGAPAPSSAAPPPTPAATAQPSAPATSAAATTAGTTNVFAIVSLVAGIASLIFNPFMIVSIVAIILGIVALNQIKKAPGTKGKGLAVGGIILGALFFIVTLIALIVAGAALSVFF